MARLAAIRSGTFQQVSEKKVSSARCEVPFAGTDRGSSTEAACFTGNPKLQPGKKPLRSRSPAEIKGESAESGDPKHASHQIAPIAGRVTIPPTIAGILAAGIFPTRFGIQVTASFALADLAA